VLNLSWRIEDITGWVEGRAGGICSMPFFPVQKWEEPWLSDQEFCQNFPRMQDAQDDPTLVGACSSSFPSASYTIGFASGFALHTLRRIVVFPAFALPMMRMRNWGHLPRISSALKAPCLNGRASIDDWASLFVADIAGEDERWIWRLDGGQFGWSRTFASFSG